MSAVSSESHEPAVEPGQPAAGHADFGANEWLVEELYQRYLADPGSVDRAWWSFFADYHPTLPNGAAPQSPQPQTRPAGTGTRTGARAGSSGSSGSAGPSGRAGPARSPEPGSAAASSSCR